MKQNKPVRYWANPGGDDGLRNGSFVRWRGGHYYQWMNGDCMGDVSQVPPGFTEVTKEHAEKLLPACCK